MEEDTIVMGLDGLFDNDFYHEIVSTVAGHIDVVEASKYSKMKRIYIWQSTSQFSLLDEDQNVEAHKEQENKLES